jgi:hypothetical protein
VAIGGKPSASHPNGLLTIGDPFPQRSKTMFDDQLLMTISQVMQALQVSRQTLQRMEITGELRPVRRPNKRSRIMYLRTDVMKLLEQMQVSR